jgi:hypothetical protein
VRRCPALGTSGRRQHGGRIPLLSDAVFTVSEAAAIASPIGAW